MKYLGIEIPSSILALASDRHVWQYFVGPARADSYGVTSAPNWPTPTALEFETRTMRAERVASVGPMPDRPVPPDLLLAVVERALRRGVTGIADALRDGGMVLDTDGLGSMIYPDAVGRASVRTTGTAWPAVPGVTVAYEDVTR